MLGYLGPHLSNDPILFAKVVRLGKAFMKEVRRSENIVEQLHSLVGKEKDQEPSFYQTSSSLVLPELVFVFSCLLSSKTTTALMSETKW